MLDKKERERIRDQQQTLMRDRPEVGTLKLSLLIASDIPALLNDIDELRGKIDQLSRIIDTRGCGCTGICVDCQEYLDVTEAMNR